MSGMGDFLRMEAMVDVVEGDSRDAGMLLVEANMFDQMDQQQRQRDAEAAAARQRAEAEAAARRQAEARARAEAEARREAEERAREAERQRNYELHRNSGQSMMSQGNFNGAIQEFQKALSYDPHHYMVRYDIACCYMQVGNIAAAYKAILDLRSHADDIADYQARLAACEGALLQQAGAQLKRATDSYSQQDLHTATAALALAKGLLPESHSADSMRQSIANFEQKIAWEQQRARVNESMTKGIDLYNHGALDQSLAILTSCQKKYEEFSLYLDKDEVANLTAVKECLILVNRGIESRVNLANQKFITDNLPQALEHLSRFETDLALQAIEAISKVALKITKPEDVGADYVNPHIWQQSIQELNAWINAYNARAQQEPTAAAASIFHSGKDNAIAKISEYEKKYLSARTAVALRDHWAALDQRDITGLLNRIESLVLCGLVKRNWLMSCCMDEWYVKDQAVLEGAIRNTVLANLPTAARPPIMLTLHNIVKPQVPAMLYQSQERQAEAIPLAHVVSPVPEHSGAPVSEDMGESVAKQRAVMM